MEGKSLSCSWWAPDRATRLATYTRATFIGLEINQEGWHMDHYHTVQLATMNLLLVCCALLVSISGSFQLRNESFPSLLHLERFIELTSQLSSSRKNNFDFAGPRADCLADVADVIDRLWGCWRWGHQRHSRHAGCHGCDRSRYGAWVL